MRTALTIGGIESFIGMHEAEFLTKFGGSGQIQKDDLNEREKELARKLTSRGLLARQTNEDGVFFMRNINRDVKAGMS